MAMLRKRHYSSAARKTAAEATKEHILNAAKKLFARQGIDGVTINEIAERAGVSVATVYAHYKSKEGILRAIMRRALFGHGYQAAHERLVNVEDAAQLVALTASVAREIHEGESAELGSLRSAASFSPALRKIEQEFEMLRFQMQEDRINRLYAQSKAKRGLAVTDARRLMWMYTSRDVYRMLVHESGWTPQQYQEWLASTLVSSLVADSPDHPKRARRS